MPITQPDLADLTYTRVRDLLRARIPIHAPEWTDHNDSDPGVAILQLFAWLADQLGYRLNRVPDRNYLAFLEMIGIRLQPATAASTKLALLLTHPESLTGRTAVPAGSKAKATTGTKPEFETDEEIEIVPAQLAAMITTISSDLRDLVDASVGGEALDASDVASWIEAHLSIVWDGTKPKLEAMPAEPVAIGQYGSDDEHRYLWLGFAFASAPSAAFVGQRVTLTVQLDDDEQPDVLAHADCMSPGETSGAATSDLAWYRPRQVGEATGRWLALRVVSDSTAGFTRSGEIVFDVPSRIGPIPDDEWVDLLTVEPLTMAEMCDLADEEADEPPPQTEPHPLPGSLPTSLNDQTLVVPISGWIRVGWGGDTMPPLSIRQVTFNAVPATAATTVTDEIVATGTGNPGQSYTLANTNLLDGTLELAVEDVASGDLVDWTEVETLDASGPDDTVYLLDREAGELRFGDGSRGRPPPLNARVIALTYRYGGGEDTEVDVGTITTPSSLPAGVKVTNLYAARGGRDAETLEEARERAPRELKVLRRAVTASDYQLLAKQTEGLRVARAEVVPLRRPYADPTIDGPGLDMGEDDAAGALSVIILPDDDTAFPRPTEGMLRTVCAWLDGYRLVTTEVHVVPPMYVRLYDWKIVVYASPGYSTADVRAAIVEQLSTWLHPLTGGDDGEGFPLAAVIPHSAILARLFRVTGVARVDTLELSFDGYAPQEDPDDDPVQVGRNSRLTAGVLTACPDDADAAKVTTITLAADELPFVDLSSIALEVRSS
ncbi:MAG TPA: putative baseplate assembly protein [Myxococcota bacterium]|nr:putative baseplate assembly protein [Myxococcota bacterium]